MILLHTYRQDLETVRNYFFPYIKLWKQTNLNNIRDTNVQGGEFLSVVAINCLIDEIILLIEKKLINTVSQSQKIKLSDAQGVIFYRILIALPLPAEQFYFNVLRNDYILQLDQQLIEKKIYQQPVQKRQDIIRSADFYFEDE